MKTYTTVEAARVLGITSGTFHRWIREKRIQAPPVRHLEGNQRVRIWTEEDVERVKKYMTEHYWGLGSKKPRKKRKKK